MATGIRTADEPNSAPRARCGVALSVELQMLQHLAHKRVRAAAQLQHCIPATASSGQKVYESDILHIVLILPFSQWMGPESSSSAVWLPGFRK